MARPPATCASVDVAEEQRRVERAARARQRAGFGSQDYDGSFSGVCGWLALAGTHMHIGRCINQCSEVDDL